MEASAPDASLPIASDALLIAPHPREPDNVLFGLCARCKHRMTERMRVVTDDSAAELGARPEETDGARIRDLWWADLRRIRGIRSQTVAGALAKYQIARSVYEWSSGLDLTLGEFLVEASDERVSSRRGIPGRDTEVSLEPAARKATRPVDQAPLDVLTRQKLFTFRFGPAGNGLPA